VPQLLKLEGVSSETATLSWQPPSKNNAPENYTIMYVQEPAPQFAHWRRYKVGGTKRFTLTDLRPGTRYITCVLASHNFGFAAMSKALGFKTRKWWYDDEEEEEWGLERTKGGAPGIFLTPAWPQSNGELEPKHKSSDASSDYSAV